MQIEDLNKTAWDHAVDQDTNPYTQVVSAQQVAEAKCPFCRMVAGSERASYVWEDPDVFGIMSLN